MILRLRIRKLWWDKETGINGTGRRRSIISGSRSGQGVAVEPDWNLLH
jgi:hypothetical protein